MTPSDTDILRYIEANADLIKNAFGGLSAINTSKIVGIHGRITKQDYEIDAGRVADRLLSLEAEIEL